MADPMRRRLGVFLSVAVLFGGLAAADAPPASAQGFGWLGGLFGGGTPQRSPSPAYPGYGSPFGSGRYGDGSDAGGYYNAPRHRAQRKKRAPDPTQDASAKPQVPAKAATLFVDVYGDSMGQLLAGGLDEALADRPEVGVVHKAKGSTGLVTTSFYDWPKTIREQLYGKDKDKDVKAKDGKDAKVKDDKDAKGTDKKDAKAKESKPRESETKDAGADKAAKEKIDVAVMMIGINDRQTITEDGKRYEPGTDEWTAIYKKRVLAIDEAFAKKKIPLIWVGLPITKDDNFADDMAALNDIYRDAAAKTGATYVDTWEAFSDENGNFAASGPDINGQTTRLRAADGIHFTKAGARKLAHFVETHVRHDLDGKAPVPQLPTAEVPTDGKKPAGAKKGENPAVAVVKPEAGPIKNLAEAPISKDGTLMQVPTADRAAVAANATRDKPDAPPAARADNFRWPEPPAAPPGPAKAQPKP